MSIESCKTVDVVNCDIASTGGAGDSLNAAGVFRIQCLDKDGNLKWEAENHNLVVNTGVQFMNSKTFTGSAYTATWYLGLYGAGASNTPAATDTMASHPGWAEVTPYSNATRPACTFNTATTANPSVITNSSSAATYNINATATIGGAFLTTDNTKSGTTGTLFSAADFQSPGDRSVVNGDTILVTYTFNLTAT